MMSQDKLKSRKTQNNILYELVCTARNKEAKNLSIRAHLYWKRLTSSSDYILNFLLRVATLQEKKPYLFNQRPVVRLANIIRPRQSLRIDVLQAWIRRYIQSLNVLQSCKSTRSDALQSRDVAHVQLFQLAKTREASGERKDRRVYTGCVHKILK